MSISTYAGLGRRFAPAVLAAAVGSRAMSAVTKLPDDVPTITDGAQAYTGDLRSTSGVGLGDGLSTHTAKWLQGDEKSPMQYIKEAAPIEIKGLTVASYGVDDPALGCPVEYINLKGTTPEYPAVCKYTGNKYYSNAWKKGGWKDAVIKN